MVYTALRLSVVAAATAMALAGGTGIGSATGPPYPDPGRCARPRPPLCRDVRRGGQPPSWIDPLVLASVLPQSFHLVAAEVLEHQGLNGLVFRRLGHQFVERHEREHGVADADRLAKPMRGGRSLVIFPEGGLARPPGCALSTWAHSWWPPKPACPLSRRLSAGRGQYLWPEHHFPRREAIDITVGEPIWHSGTDWAAAIELQHATRNAVLPSRGSPTSSDK